jgi:hypothetical protein
MIPGAIGNNDAKSPSIVRTTSEISDIVNFFFVSSEMLVFIRSLVDAKIIRDRSGVILRKCSSLKTDIEKGNQWKFPNRDQFIHVSEDIRGKLLREGRITAIIQKRAIETPMLHPIQNFLLTICRIFMNNMEQQTTDAYIAVAG